MMRRRQIPKAQRTEISQGEADDYFRRLSPEDQDACLLDEIAFGRWELEVVGDVVRRVPPERHSLIVVGEGGKSGTVKLTPQ